MNSGLGVRLLLPDQSERIKALDTSLSVLVQAPAGAGKTDLLARRFLRLLGEVDDAGQIVAITFTKAAAAEMRNRILSELDTARLNKPGVDMDNDPLSMAALAERALAHSRKRGWQLPEIPARLRIATIDSFCRDLAIQEPLLFGFGSDLEIAEQPSDLYRRAARSTLQNVGQARSDLAAALEELLLWRDNDWHQMEELLVAMLGQRDRWMQEFVLDREQDWDLLRERLERPFAQMVSDTVCTVDHLFDQVPGARQEVLALGRFAYEQTEGRLHASLAELADFPPSSSNDRKELETARLAWSCVASMLLSDGQFRQRVDRRHGFPKGADEKNRLEALVSDLSNVDGLQSALGAVANLPPARYADEDWRLVRTCFALLRHAAAELRTVFAETGTCDFIEVAQLAHRVLKSEDGLPSDSAIAVADGIRHLLVDEFQDTSRRQHQLLADVAAAWPDPEGRTIFVVGDPTQSIYSFRDADAELFLRVRDIGLELPGQQVLPLDPVRLTANFRSAPALVEELNRLFSKVFAAQDGSGISFHRSEPTHQSGPVFVNPRIELHVEFTPQSVRGQSEDRDRQNAQQIIARQRNAAQRTQINQMVALVGSQMDRVERARATGAKYRIATLGRTRACLAPIAAALREAAIPFRAVELETLHERPEVQDALALGRAILNPFDRIAWLGALRAPWCGLTLEQLYRLTGADDPVLLRRPVAELLAKRLDLLEGESRQQVQRMLAATDSARRLRAAMPIATIGTWLEQIWVSIGGAYCVDAHAVENLRLLWKCLDGLPNRELDFLGPALDVALEHLTAVPDPEASSDCGVQVMTIHKSKGLEFEVVIVPELQASTRQTPIQMFSWLERGLAQPNATGQITEFLIAPLQPKGANRGKTKEWVDRRIRERETQEMRRILYVAGTRAREELHFFARPEYRDRDGDLRLIEPANCLLATAWPALKDDVVTRFEEWKAAQSAGAHIVSMRASEDNGVALVRPAAQGPAILRRLRPGVAPQGPALGGIRTSRGKAAGLEPPQIFPRHEGGIPSRALGQTVHKLLELAAVLRKTLGWDEVSSVLPKHLPTVTAQIRSFGIAKSEAESIAAQALQITHSALHDPMGQWILSPHADAANEGAWSGTIGGVMRSIRADRVFRGGLEPFDEDRSAWWIIDYKTAHSDALDPATAVLVLRGLFAPQLEAYAEMLGNLQRPDIPIRAGLYYPRLLLFDWWETAK